MKLAVDQPDFEFELDCMRRGLSIVAGVDEAGRGPLAGPVVAAAVILDPDAIPAGLNDSKKLGPARREQLYDVITSQAKVAIGVGDVARIDRDNILQASLWAMARAIAGLPSAPEMALIDGNRCPTLPCLSQAVIKGDGRCLSIAAASIIAKVTRDRIMQALAGDFPDYGWQNNKGYGTRAHLEAIDAYGVTEHHRRSFAPVRQAIEDQ